MAKFTRRQWLKGGLVIGGIAAFAASYRDVAKRAVDGLVDGLLVRLLWIGSTVTLYYQKVKSRRKRIGNLIPIKLFV